MDEDATEERCGGRWWEGPEGIAAVTSILDLVAEVNARLDTCDYQHAWMILLDWESRVDVTPLPLKSLHSVRAALDDARAAVIRGAVNDARAFLQASVAMMRG